MKKIILLTATIATAMWSEGITINGSIPPAAIVGFDNPITENLLDNTFTFKDIVIDIGSIPLGGKIAPVTKQIYAKTNSSTGTSIQIVDHTNPNSGFLSGHLVDEPQENLVAMKYTLKGSAYSIKNHPVVELTSGTNDGASSIGTFIIEQKNITSPDKPEGHYGVVFDVIIAAQ
jgi:RNase P/RNase MRP subunit p29